MNQTIRDAFNGVYKSIDKLRDSLLPPGGYIQKFAIGDPVRFNPNMGTCFRVNHYDEKSNTYEIEIEGNDNRKSISLTMISEEELVETIFSPHHKYKIGENLRFYSNHAHSIIVTVKAFRESEGRPAYLVAHADNADVLLIADEHGLEPVPSKYYNYVNTCSVEEIAGVTKILRGFYPEVPKINIFGVPIRELASEDAVRALKWLQENPSKFYN